MLQPLPHALTVVFTGAVIRLLRSTCPVCSKLQTDWGQAFLLATSMFHHTAHSAGSAIDLQEDILEDRAALNKARRMQSGAAFCVARVLRASDCRLCTLPGTKMDADRWVCRVRNAL